MDCIRYADGYKYQLRSDASLQTDIKPPKDIVTPWIRLTCDGLMTMVNGYAWDGPSGPTIDTPDSMRGSLYHDGGYQLIREGHLDMSYRPAFDALLRRLCIEDGMWAVRADAWYAMVRDFGQPHADPAKASPDKFAPQACNGPAITPAQREAA